MTAQLIVHEDLGHTRVVDNMNLDQLTQAGWRLVAICQEADVDYVLVPSGETKEAPPGIYPGSPYGSDYSTRPYGARPMPDGLMVPNGMKLVVTPITKTRFVIARSADETIKSLSERLDEAESRSRSAEERASTAERDVIDAKEAAKKADADVQHWKSKVEAESRWRAESRDRLNAERKMVQTYEAHLSKLRKALGDMQIDKILKGDAT